MCRIAAWSCAWSLGAEKTERVPRDHTLHGENNLLGGERHIRL